METETLSRLDQELMLLIIKYLEKGPCHEAAQVLTDLVESKDLLPERYDWEGGKHSQTLAEVAACHPNLNKSFLPKICQRLGPLLDKELKPNFPGLKSLLSGGSQSLLRTEKSLAKSQLSSYVYTARQHGTSLLVPNSVKVHNTVNVLRSREYSGPVSRSLMISSHKYSNIRQHYVNLGHLSAVFCVLYDKLGQIIVTGADDLLIKLWRARDGKLLATLRGCSGEISDIAIDNRNILLAAGTVDKTIRIWNLQTLAPISVLVGHQGIITGVNFCPLEVNGFNYLASTSTDGCIGFWKYKLDTDISKTVFHEPVMFNERIRPGNAHILCSSFSPGGLFLATGSGDHHVRVYKMDGVDSPLGILEVEEHSDKVDSIQWAHTHLRFVSGSRDGTALIWYYKCSQWRFTRLDMNTCLPNSKETTDETVKKVKVTMVAWDASDRWVITAINLNFQIKIWDSFTGDLVQVLKGHTNEVFVLESHPFDSRVLLSAGHDGLIIIWDILSSKQRGYKWFHNIVEGQGEGALFDGKWSPDGTTCALTDSYGHLLVYGLGGFKRPTNIPRELFFHTDYRTLNRPNGLFEPTFDEVTNVPPHLMPPPFLVDLNGTPYPPELQRLVPGREHADDTELLPDITTNDDGQVEIVEENERNVERPMEVEGQRHYNDHGHVYIQTSHAVRRSRNGESSSQAEGTSPTLTLQTQNRNFVKRVPLSQYKIVLERINSFAEIESEEFAKESKKTFDTFMTQQPTTPMKKEKKKKAPRQARTRAEHTETIQEQFEDPENLSLTGSEANSNDSDESQVDVSDLCESSSSSGGTPSSDYSDWIHEGVHLEPPKRVRRHTKAKPVQVSLPKQMIPEEVPDIYKPSEWLAEVVPKKAPYYPQMGDEVMFFKQGYAKYVDAVRAKGIYELSRLRSAPWGNLILQEPELVKVVGIKYEIAPPRICCLKLGVMKPNGKLTSEFFNIKYHDMPDVIDFFTLRQTYETAMSREWNVGDRFCSMIDDAWWWGTIESKPSPNKSPFLGYKILWDNNERENISPWDMESLKEGKEPPEPGGSLPVEPEEIQELLYHPRPDEWPQGNRDATCEKIITGLEEVMGLSVAEPFLVPVDIMQYPAYAYVVEYPVDLTTLRARFQNRFYRRVTSAQFDVRYLAANAEKFNEPHSHIVKYARIITDLLLRIIKEPNPVDVPVVYHELLQNYETSSSEDDEEQEAKRRVRPTAVTRAQREAQKQKQLRKPFNWRTACREVLEILWVCPDSEPFRKPVDKLDHPDYDKIVIAPMDLGTIREELRGDNYESPLDFIKDVKRVFNNSRNYNQNKRSKIYMMTTKLSEFAEEHLRRLNMLWNRQKKKMEGRKEKTGEKKLRRLKRRRRKIRRTLVESDEEVVSTKRRGKNTYENDQDFNPDGKTKSTSKGGSGSEEEKITKVKRRSSYRSRSNSQDNEEENEDQVIPEPQPSTSTYEPVASTSRGRFLGRAAKRKFKPESEGDSMSQGDDSIPEAVIEQRTKKLKVMYPKRKQNESEEEEIEGEGSGGDASEMSEVKKDPLSLNENEEESDEDYNPSNDIVTRKRPTRIIQQNQVEDEDDDDESDEDYTPSSKEIAKRKQNARAEKKSSRGARQEPAAAHSRASNRRTVHPKKIDKAFEYYSEGGSESEDNSNSSSESGSSEDSDDEDWSRGGEKTRRIGTRKTNRVGTRMGRHYRENPSDLTDCDSGEGNFSTRARQKGVAAARRGRVLVTGRQRQATYQRFSGRGRQAASEEEDSNEQSEEDNSEEEERRPARRVNVVKRGSASNTSTLRNVRGARTKASPLLMTCSGESSEGEEEEGGETRYDSRQARRTRTKGQSYAVHSSETETEDEGQAAQVSFSRRGRLRKPTAKLRGE
uniref:Bromodomain and WD repeat-containing protein 3 n=1 Tax=Cacopsylla melanoneura TaxID=428564 RepID=A0A8D8RXJ3_9HEMI